MKKSILPVNCRCRNCGSSLVGRYCHVCGQDVFAGMSRRMRDMAMYSLDVVFAWDNKFWRSIIALIVFPGWLTKEYLDGKIVRYIHPSKLFWFLSILFFTLLLSGANKSERRDGSQPNSATAQNTEIAIADSLAQDDAPDFIIKTSKQFEENRIKLISVLKSAAPYLMLLLMPFFALLVLMFYPRRNYYYADYFIFSLHYHAFLFLLFSLGLVVKKLLPGSGIDAVWVVMIIPAAYLIISLRKVFRAKIIPAVFKIGLLSLIYIIFMLMVTICALVAWAKLSE